MSGLVFEKFHIIGKYKSKKHGYIAVGRLWWGASIYYAISGPWQKGQIPDGPYRIKVKNVDTSPDLADGYKDRLTDERWFIPIEEVPKTYSSKARRTGLGIHPEGGKFGTLGCIGLIGANASRFWKRWNQTPLIIRPKLLTVKTFHG